MRQQRLLAKDSYDKVNIAAVWPAGPQLVPLPVPDLDHGPAAGSDNAMPTLAAPDVPVAVGKLIVAAYVALIAAFALATAGSRESIFMIAISTLFVVIYFTVPRIMLGQERGQADRPGFDAFMADGMQTLTGHSTGPAALVQMLIVPVSLTLAILAMGIAAAFML